MLLPLSDRRTFLQTAAAGIGAFTTSSVSRIAAAAEPIVRTNKSHMKLSLAAYSFHRLLPRDKPLAEFAQAKMTLDGVIQFAAEQDLDGVELTSYYFPRDVSHDYLIGLKEKTFRLGLDISGTAIGNDFCLPPGPKRDAQMKLAQMWIDHAATIGAPVIRIFAGHVAMGDTEDQAIERCVAAIDEAVGYAAGKGVCLALENHGGITSTPEQVLKIVKGVKPSPWFGVNFDSGNFSTADPYGDLEKIAPYTMNAQIKVEMTPKGKREPADLKRVVDILKRANYRGYLVLEYEAAEDPLKAVPRYLRQLRELIG